MGILDEAIREHLELKSHHGADESELEGLESEAFGPADRPDATEAQTEVISPGSSITAPAGEGDQLDKVFEAKRQAEADTAESEQAPQASAATESPSEESTVAEHEIPAPPAPDPQATAEAAAPVSPPETSSPPAPADDGEPDWPDEPAPREQTEQPKVEASTEAWDEEGGDAGDALQRERMTLSSHPTEHYDVDAAIAEEEEIDILSESSLSDELDRALDGPSEPEAATEAPAAPAEQAEEEPEPAFDDEHQGEPEEIGIDDEADAESESEADSGEFFDQDDPLEATPDFLEETPEHDRLWFEQKPPKDFEF